MKVWAKIIFAAMSLTLTATAATAVTSTIKVGTASRSILYYAPPGIAANRPLFLSLHGMNQDAPFQQGYAKLEAIADTAKFVAVYPSGIGNSWDISGNTDINFILAIIDTMYNRHKIDKNRVYVSGFSMGGMMSYHAANKIADKIAAIGPVSGYLFANPVSSSRPMPIIHTHGTDDPTVNYGGLAAILQKWRNWNQCPTTSTKISPYPAGKTGSVATWEYWGPCKNSAVVHIALTGKGHWYSTDAASVHTSVEIWNFVKNYALNGSTPASSAGPTSSSVLLSSSSVVPQGAFSSMAQIPGTIQAENYDVGGETTAYHDNDATNSGAVYRTDGVDITGDQTVGYKVGWTIAGEWLEYTVNVATAGPFKWEVQVSSGGDGGVFHILADSVNNITGAVTVPNTTSWDTYTVLNGTTTPLTAGKHVLRFVIDGSYFNLDWIKFTEIPVQVRSRVKPQALSILGITRYDLLGRAQQNAR